MTSKIKVDNINKVSDDSNIINKCGTTITLGASGDSINLAAGASQTGFGRTGTVDWQTGDIKTGTFTAANGKGYFCNTTASVFNLTLPSSPSAGDIVGLKDYANTFETYALTLDRNGSNINGDASNFTLATNGTALTLVYVDTSRGWVITDEGSNSLLGKFVTATVSGSCNTLTTAPDCANVKIATFYNPGCFTVTCGGNLGGSNTVDYMVIAGAGGGGADRGGGGGAGGWRASSGTATGSYCAGPAPLTGPVSALPVTAQAYPIQVGGGGPGSPGSAQPSAAANGTPSIFSSVTSTGGGGGMSSNHPELGQPGGSGGAGAGSGGTGCAAKGAGNTPSQTPPQGNPGGKGYDGPNPSSGGGGGGIGFAGQCAGPGQNPAPSNPTGDGGGPGGIGVASSITGSAVKYAGGGGGAHPNAHSGQWGFGGTHPGGDTTQPQTVRFGAGNGAQTPGSTGCAGTPRSGGGGGAGACGGANGGSGVVIIRYKFQ